MKQINLTSSFKMNHLKYCRGIYDRVIHDRMRTVIHNSDNSVRYLSKRPFGKIVRYKNRNYPEIYSRKKKLLLSREARRELTDLLLLNFNKIISSDPIEILKIENSIYTKISDMDSLSLEQVKERTQNFLEYVFNYNSFSQEPYMEVEWSAYKFIKELNISICVYCNAQFTFTIYKEVNNLYDENHIFKIRPALDHIFPKHMHPLLALSVYNLIPTCDTCNSSLKGSESINLDTFVHPYIDDINEMGYFTQILNIEDKDYYSQIVGKSMDYTIELVSRERINDKKIEEYEKLFGINHRYDMHKSYLNKQIVLSLIYNEVYLKRLEISYGKEFFSPAMLKDILYTTDINNSILSKVTVDILKEIRLNEYRLNKQQIAMLEKVLSGN